MCKKQPNFVDKKNIGGCVRVCTCTFILTYEIFLSNLPLFETNPKTTPSKIMKKVKQILAAQIIIFKYLELQATA